MGFVGASLDGRAICFLLSCAWQIERLGERLGRVDQDDVFSRVNVCFLPSFRVHQEIQEKEGLLANQYVI